jgi:ligand-binding SRPBCC domain-containing protein
MGMTVAFGTLACVTPRYRLERAQRVRRPLPEVVAFFSDADNLERLTPDFVHFRILTPRPIVMQPGTLLEYELRLLGIPVRWRSRIETFEPPGPDGRIARFSDTQVTGPYKRWHHVHEFHAVLGGTEIRDVVDYELRLGPLGTVAHALFVRRALNQIFEYRRARCEELFG